MFHKEVPSSGESQTGLLVLTAVSIAITIPFIFYFKSIADSLQTMAEGKRVTER